MNWQNPDEFVSGEYVVIKALHEDNTYYMVAVLMDDPEPGRPCKCMSLETNNEFLVNINSNIWMCELV